MRGAIGSDGAIGWDEAKSREPSAPWLWRDDWARGRVEARPSGGNPGWIFAILWNAFVALMLGVAVFSDAGGDNRRRVILAMSPFVLAGLFLLGLAIRKTYQRRRFGRSVLHLETRPAAVGGQLRGSLQVEGLERLPEGGFDLRLRCDRHLHYKATERRRTSMGHRSWILWQDDYNVAGSPGAGAAIVPVYFDVPAGSKETSRDVGFPYADLAWAPAEWFEWALVARASIPGIDYEAEFPVPVFDVEAIPERTPVPFEKRPTGGTSRIRFSQTPDGATVLHMPSSQGVGCLVSGLLLLAASAWLAWFVPGFEYRTAAAVAFGVFLLGEALLIMGLLVTPRSVTLRHEEISILYGGYGITRTQVFPRSDVKSVELRTVDEPGRGGRPRVYLHRDSGKPIELDPGLSGHSAGEAFAAELCGRFGLPEFVLGESRRHGRR